MHLVDRIGITTLATVAAGIILYWLSAELVILWEMGVTGAENRSELGNDLGVGILFFLFGVPITLLGTVCLSLYVWGWTGAKRRRKD